MLPELVHQALRFHPTLPLYHHFELMGALPVCGGEVQEVPEPKHSLLLLSPEAK
ncbi:MAG: hypothetical protein RIC19_18670 [Phaeodactylibacter sp.]|uniref:hypothetical protein n=1 Tax=Phaeodactylibacter sp. TaxID=1940289 RepID=UPI0032EB8235